MNTFLPYMNFIDSVRCLDNKRLGKQRVEAFQILKALTAIANNTKYGWKCHPCTLMWLGYEHALMYYCNCCIDEWVRRGFKNTMARYDISFDIDHYPSWLGNEKVHASHRSNLLRKDPVWYGQFGWNEPNDLLYYWPTKDNTYC